MILEKDTAGTDIRQLIDNLLDAPDAPPYLDDDSAQRARAQAACMTLDGIREGTALDAFDAVHCLLPEELLAILDGRNDLTEIEAILLCHIRHMREDYEELSQEFEELRAATA